MVKTISFALCMMILSYMIRAEDVVTKLSPPDGAVGDWFGSAVSIDGETAIIGSYGDDDDKGSAYIFERQSGGDWVFSQKIVASDGSIHDRFGYSLGVYGGTAVIGAYESDSVYIYEKQINGTWIEIQKVTGSDTVSDDDQFGFAVSIYEDIAVIGAWYDDESTGSVYIFQRQGNSQWVESQKLTASDASSLSYFGVAVDIHNDTIVVGAYGQYQTYIFERSDGGSWIETSILSAASDQFGRAVSIYHDTLIVGARYDDTLAMNAGAAYVYTKTDENLWQWNQTLFARNATENDRFGDTVSIYNQTIVVGAYYDDDKGFNSGAAYIFNKASDREWIEIAKITEINGGTYHYFGGAASIHGENILIGAYGAIYGEDISVGTAYIMKNWKSCEEMLSESVGNQMLINWEWTICNFTASPTPQPTANPIAPTTAVPTGETDGASEFSVILTAVLCAMGIFL